MIIIGQVHSEASKPMPSVKLNTKTKDQNRMLSLETLL